MADIINIEVLADGTIKVITDKVSMQNHMNAESLLRLFSGLLGGTTKQTARHNLGINMKHVLDDHCHDGHTHTHG